MNYRPPIKGNLSRKKPQKNPIQILVDNLDAKISEAENAIQTTRNIAQELKNDTKNKTDELKKEVEDFIKNAEIFKGERGEPGEDAKPLDEEEIIEKVISKIPNLDEGILIKKVLKSLPENKASLKIIQEKIDPESILEKILALPEDKFKFKSTQIEDLEEKVKIFWDRYPRGYLHGGGDTVVAGTNISITTNSAGQKVINSTLPVLAGVTSLNSLTGAITLAAGTGIVLTPSGNTITISTSGAGGVTSVTGTTNRITSTGGTTPVIDISATYVGQSSITTVGTIGTGTWQGMIIAEGYGGTNQSTYTLGDILYSSAANTLAKLAGNITATKKFLRQTGNGAVSAAPAWDTIAASDLPTANLSGTSNQVILSASGTGVLVGNTSITLSTPQDIATSSTPQFARLGLGAAADANHILLLSGGTITTDKHQIDSAVTWNAAGVTFTGWKLNVTNTASALASLMLDLQVGATSVFSVDRVGNLIMYGSTSGSTKFQAAPNASGTIALPATTDTVVVKDFAQTVSNKRITWRTVTVSQSATPAINTDSTDVAYITGLAQAITNLTTNMTGSGNANDKLIISITDNGTARAITWGSLFEASGNVALPTTTVVSTRLDVGFLWNVATSKWRCVAVA